MSRILDEDTVADCERWVAPQMATGEDGVQPCEPHDDETIAALRQAAIDEGRAEGRVQGLNEGRAEIAAGVARLRELAELLAAPLTAVDDAVVEQLASLSRHMARHLVRREIAIDAGVVRAAIDRAIACLPLATREVRIHLHPDDVTLVGEDMVSNATTTPWQFVGDPLIERGGCRVETETSEIDATVETRLNALFAEMLGGTRHTDDDESGD